MRRLSFISCLLLPLGLAACGGPSSGGARVGDYVGGTVQLECAPFARALTGVMLYGPAADWWWQAEGRYTRSANPEVGSVLVFQRSARLASGHVSVVTKVLSRREIMVSQANWVRHRVTEDQPVVDVSTSNDWSEVRVWWPPSGQMGMTPYPAYGFVRASKPASRDQLVAGTPQAIKVATAGR